MDSVIKKLWLGELAPWSEAEEKHVEAMRYAKILEDRFQALAERLDEEGKGLFSCFEAVGRSIFERITLLSVSFMIS